MNIPNLNAIRDWANKKFSLVSATGCDLGLSIDTSTYVMTLELKNSAGQVLSSKTIDFPIESMVVNASYKDGKLTLTLQNGQTLEVDISAIVSGLVNDARTIAGIDLKDDITKEELITALGIPAWAMAANKPSYTAAEVGALPSDTKIPTTVAELTDAKDYAKTTDVEALSGRMDTAESDIETLATSTAALGGRLDTAEQNIANQDTRLSEAEDTINQHSSQIAEISDEIKVEKSVVVDDYALVDSGSGVLNDLMVYGRSKQDKTTGSNILKIRDIESESIGGITYNKNNDGSISMVGTRISSASLIITDGTEILEAGEYTFILNGNSVNVGGGLVVGGESIISSSNIGTLTFTTNGGVLSLSLKGSVNGAVYNEKLYISIVKGKDSSVPFEPYTGGIPSPNPQYPSAIRALDRVGTNNKNFLNTGYKTGDVLSKGGINARFTEDGIEINATTTASYTKLITNVEVDLPVGQYYFFNDPPYSGTGVYMQGYLTHNGTITQIYQNGSFTIEKGDTFSFDIQSGYSTLTNYTKTIKPMIVSGNVAPTSYVPYGHTESAIPTLYGIPVASGGNYVDKSGQHWISDELDLDSGVITRYCGYADLGTLTYSYDSNNAYFACPLPNGDTNIGLSVTYPMICTNYRVSYSRYGSDFKTAPNGICAWSRDSNYLDFKNTSYTNVNDFKASMDGQSLVYKLATPTTEPIPQATINSIRQLRSFADKTHIYCDNGSLEAVIAENTEVGNAIGNVAENVADVQNDLSVIGEGLLSKLNYTKIVDMVTSDTTKEIGISSLARMMIVGISSDAESNFFLNINSNSSGTVYVTPIFKGSKITLTTGNKTLTVTKTTAAIQIYAIIFDGSIS